MTTLSRLLAASAVLVLSSVVQAQTPPPDPNAPPSEPPAVQAAAPDQAPPQAAPQAAPEAPPPASIPPPAYPVNTFPPGQWVMTAQYGNVWMPYGDQYVYRPLFDGGDPSMYVYSPAWGWRWVPAPWVYGVGPAPFWGSYGYARYGWYGRPFYGHVWYGYRDGYPPGYRGYVYTHPNYVHPGYATVYHNNGGGTVYHSGGGATVSHSGQPAQVYHPQAAAHPITRPPPRRVEHH
jgi:hypothetical protein